jgi:hypothetical protein
VVGLGEAGSAGDGTKNLFSKKSVTVQLRSLDEIRGKEITVSLNKVESKSGSPADPIYQYPISGDRSNRVNLALKAASDLHSIVNLLRGDSTFEFGSSLSVTPGERAHYFIRNGSVVAVARGRQLAKSEIRTILQLLHGEFSYYGTELAYISGVKNFSMLKARIARDGISSDIFVFDGDQLVPVKASLFAKDPRAVSTLFEGFNVFFREQVSVTGLSH